MSEGYEINTVEAPSFDEYLDRYSRGINIGMDTALGAAHQVYDNIDDRALFGSLTVHPSYYGVEELKRPTDLSVDFMTTEEEVAEISEDFDVWEYDNCYFAEMPAEVDGEVRDFAVGLVPVDRDIFADGQLPPIRLGEDKLEDAEEMRSKYGSMPVVDAETNYALKARRFTDSLLQHEDHLKVNDLSDQASMHLANQRRDETVLDYEDTGEKVVDYTSGQFPPYEVADDGTRSSEWLEKTRERVGPHITDEDWNDIVRDWEMLEDQINEHMIGISRKQ